MKTFFLILIFLGLFGCGTTSKKYSSEYYGDVEKITNEDFKDILELPYKENEDFFHDELADFDALSRESLARMPEPKLKIAERVDNPISQGLSLCYQKKFKEAFGLLDKMYFQYKGHPSYWNEVGTCYLLQGERRKAFLFYRKAREINANYVPAINNLGVMHQQDGDDQKAYVAFERAASINKFALTPIFNMGQLYLKYGFLDKAQTVFRALHAKNAMDVDVLNGLAIIELLHGRAQNALVYYQRIEDKEFRKPHVGINYALSLKLIGKDRDAKKIFSRITTKDIGPSAGHYNRVGAYLGAR